MSPVQASQRKETYSQQNNYRREFNGAHRWTILAIGVAAQASFSATFAGIPSTSPLLQSAYHFSANELGWVLGSISLGIAVSEVAWGIITDRIGERKTLLIGLIVTGLLLATLAVSLVPTDRFTPMTPVMMGTFLLVGAFGGSVNGSSGRAVMTWFKDGSRGFAMSVRQTAIPVGGAVGAAILPWLAINFGFRAVYSVLAAFCFVSALAAHRWLYEPHVPGFTAGEGVGTSPTPGDIVNVPQATSPLRRPDVWRVAVASGLLTVAQFAVFTFLAIFIVHVRNAPVYVATIALVIVQVLGAVLRVVTGRLTDVRGNRRLCIRIIGLIASACMIAGGIFVRAPLLMSLAPLILGGVAANTWHGVAYTEIAEMAGKERAGTALGVENTTVFLAAFATPVIIPLTVANFGWEAVWISAGIASLLAIPLIPKNSR